MSAGFWTAHAWRSLHRDGQRSLLAAACVAFGVMSLVGLRQTSDIVSDALLISPRVQQGADLLLRRADGIEERHLQALRERGLHRITPVARTGVIFLKPADSGRATIVSQALGVDPTSHPLYGSYTLRDGLDLETALARPGDAVITADLSERFDLDEGDAFAVFGAPDAPPIHLRVGGVALRTPDRRGQSVLFGLQTARERGIGRPTRVHVRLDDSAPGAPAVDASTVAASLEDDGWEVTILPATQDGSAARLFSFMLGGAGILGLLLGGIGVANTMQVLLARRKTEIATLKAIGYRPVHLLALFGLEAGLLGLVGSVAGVALGLLLANLLMDLLAGNMSFLLRYDVRPFTIVGGLLVGIATTLVFGTAAIVRASRVRPSTLLRDVAETDPRLAARAGESRRRSAALYGLLLLVFAGIASVILGSAPVGFGVVAGGLLALTLLGLLLGALLWLLARVPTGGVPLLGMALRNLRHEPLRSIHGLVALFVGVVAIGLATVVLHNADLRFESRRIDLAGINLRVYGSSAHEDALRAAARREAVGELHVDLFATVRATAGPDTLLDGLTGLVGRDPRDLRWNLELIGETAAIASPDTPTAASTDVGLPPSYLVDALAERHGLAIGDTLRLHSTVSGDESVVAVRLAGVYARTGSALDLAAPPRGLVVPREIARRLGGTDLPLQMHLAADPDHLPRVADALGAAVPGSVVIGKDTIADAVNVLVRGLFWFAVAVAGLALVAGVVLIANAVGLTMLERQREIGILRAVGYSRRQVLATVVLENAFTGLVGGLSGVLALLITIPAVNAAATDADLVLHAGQAALLVVVAALCAVLAAVGVAWAPTRRRPLAVLRGS